MLFEQARRLIVEIDARVFGLEFDGRIAPRLGAALRDGGCAGVGTRAGDEGRELCAKAAPPGLLAPIPEGKERDSISAIARAILVCLDIETITGFKHTIQIETHAIG